MNRIIIGIEGRTGAGKSISSQILTKWLRNKGYTVHCMSFAEPLKVAIRAIFDMSFEQVDGTQEQKETIDERWGVSPRKIMQFVGTELFRNQMPQLLGEGRDSIWIESLHQRILKTPENSVIIISDVRFPDEEEAIRKWAKTNRYAGTWRIARDSAESTTPVHSSDQIDLLKPDVIIDNNGSLEDLKDALKSFFKDECMNS